ncbi:MAG: amidohydrolase [Chloroflexi bacterium]|nr:amidohydrolase [Chloroflexota bacterium]
MVIVDTHCHAGVEKYEPIEVLLFQMHRSGVDKATVVQHLGQYDNRYLIECMRRFPGRFAIIGLVDVTKPEAPKTLERWAKDGIEGVRIRAEWRSPGKDGLAIWKKASELGLPVSSLGEEDVLASDEFRKLVEGLPDLKLIIEHIGRAGRDEKPPYTKFRKVLALAKHPNVFMKIGGCGEISNPPFPYQTIPPFMEMAYDAFGPTRLMWGSDWPPVVMREGYRNALQFTMERFPAKSAKDKEWVFGKTALSLFKFGEG